MQSESATASAEVIVELKSGDVSVVLPTENGSKISTAKMFGYPVSISGKPKLVEILMRDGRSTLAKISDVTPIDEAAKALLAGRPAEKNA